MYRAVVMSSLGLALLMLVAMVRGGESNGGKVLLVSMDGFRWDYLTQVSGLGNFTRLANEGCTVDHVDLTFLTKTFPCHYSIVTGLYEESHGVVSNTFYDPKKNATFTMQSKESFWWDGGEPIWVTTEKHNKSSAVYFWPGSEAEIRGYRPSIYKTYNGSVPFPERVQTSISWFLEPFNKDFVAVYFQEPDSTGHKYGPDTPQVADKVREMDGVLGLILKTLEEKKLTDVVNVILTSDHGMTNISMQDRLINLWDHIDSATVERVPDSGTVTAILPKPGQTEAVLRAASGIDHTTVYKKEDIPDHFHYKHNDRIMPVIIISDEGWMLSSNVNSSLAWNGKGNHGYSNELKTMKPIFFARGPAFHKGKKSTSIRSLDIYPLMCKLLGVTPAPNNGSLQNTAHFLVDSTSSSASRGYNGWLLLAIFAMWVLATSS